MSSMGVDDVAASEAGRRGVDVIDVRTDDVTAKEAVRRSVDVTDLRTDDVRDYAQNRRADELFFERKGPRTYLVTGDE